MDKIKKIICILIFLIGLGIFLYPIISDYIFDMQHDFKIKEYEEKIAEIEDFTDEWEKADRFNESLYTKTECEYDYEDILNVLGNGIIGSIEIPKIDIDLPIYHGTSEAVLKEGVGHIENTSLPTGKENVHVVLSGHTGLPSSKLFTDIIDLEIGDTFKLNILDKEFIYEIDQILTVKPNEVDSLKIEEGKNYVTLVTCTPYGVNSHRLLVRGHLL